jgi:hypothetical protein
MRANRSLRVLGALFVRADRTSAMRAPAIKNSAYDYKAIQQEEWISTLKK